VTKKSDVRQFQYKSKEGKGQLFSIDLIDHAGGETRCAFFGAAVDAFFDLIQERHMYSFSGGRVKRGDSRFCQFEYEINFDENATICPAEDNSACPHMLYNFAPLAVLPNQSPGTSVDVAGIIIEVEQCMDVAVKSGGTKQRLNATLFDESGVSCKLTLWDNFADVEIHQGSVVLVKAARISDFGGRSLCTSFNSSVVLDQEALATNQRASALSEWYSRQGLHERKLARTISMDKMASGNSQTIAEMQEEANSLEAPEGGGPQHETPGNNAGTGLVRYHTIIPATITFVPHERAPFYKACPGTVADDKAKGEHKTRTCNRKVEQLTDGRWRCAGGHDCETPCARWLVSFAIADQTGSQLVSCFDDTGHKIVGRSASEVARLWEMKDNDAVAAAQLEQILQSPQFTRWRLRLRSKKEVWNDEERLKISVVDCEQVGLAADGRRKLEEVCSALTSLDMPDSATISAVAAPAGA